MDVGPEKSGLTIWSLTMWIIGMLRELHVIGYMVSVLSDYFAIRFYSINTKSQ